MAKKDLKDLLGKKSPSELRKGIQQIDILKEASEALSSPEKESDKHDKEESSKDPIEQSEDKSSELKLSAKIDTENSSQSVSTKPIKPSDEEKRTSKTKQKIERQNRSISRRKPKVFSQKDIQAVLEVDKRATERYSFEIYSDQRGDIEQVCKLYEKATGKKLSASRLIREVLDTFLPDALNTFESSIRETPEQ